MGGKSAGKRQYVLFCFAWLVGVGSGCALFQAPAPPPARAPVVVMIERLPPAPEPAPPVLAAPVAEPKGIPELREADRYLQIAQQLMERGEYEGSLKESQKALTLGKDNAPSDAALFHMGLVHAHPDNAKRDNKRAIGFFARVVKSYPESPLAEQAKIWIAVLDGLEKLKLVDLEIEERKRDRAR
jgi:tetratricopeptide (TPR) repeat protein